MLEIVKATEVTPERYMYSFLCNDDDIGTLPTENIVSGSTCYNVDDGSSYIFHSGNWIKKK